MKLCSRVLVYHAGDTGFSPSTARKKNQITCPISVELLRFLSVSSEVLRVHCPLASGSSQMWICISIYYDQYEWAISTPRSISNGAVLFCPQTSVILKSLLGRLGLPDSVLLTFPFYFLSVFLQHVIKIFPTFFFQQNSLLCIPWAY